MPPDRSCRRQLAALALIGAFTLDSAVFGQEAVSTPSPEAEAERIVVTGSYIPIPTAESEGPLPVVDYTREQLTDFGANAPAEGLRHLPSFIGKADNENDSDSGAGSSRHGTGAARINLRAFGVDNTLTMINSHRAGFRVGHRCVAIVRAPYGRCRYHLNLLSDFSLI
jgi:hypothetical protein